MKTITKHTEADFMRRLPPYRWSISKVVKGETVAKANFTRRIPHESALKTCIVCDKEKSVTDMSENLVSIKGKRGHICSDCMLDYSLD